MWLNPKLNVAISFVSTNNQITQSNVRRPPILNKSCFGDTEPFKGDCIGFLLRPTWIQDDECLAMNFFFQLDWCDPTQEQKSMRETVKKLKKFMDENELWEFESRIKYMGDFAIAGTLAVHCEQMGFNRIKDKINQCGSHDEQNTHKRNKSRQEAVIAFGDTERKSNVKKKLF